MKKSLTGRIFSILIAGAMLFSLTACAGTLHPAQRPHPLRPPLRSSRSRRQNRVISPNTGSLAAYGEAVTNGIKLAIEEINAAGGYSAVGSSMSSTTMDDKGDSTEGANCFNKLVRTARAPL